MFILIFLLGYLWLLLLAGPAKGIFTNLFVTCSFAGSARSPQMVLDLSVRFHCDCAWWLACRCTSRLCKKYSQYRNHKGPSSGEMPNAAVLSNPPLQFLQSKSAGPTKKMPPTTNLEPKKIFPGRATLRWWRCFWMEPVDVPRSCDGTLRRIAPQVTTDFLYYHHTVHSEEDRLRPRHRGTVNWSPRWRSLRTLFADGCLRLPTAVPISKICR